MPAATPPPTIDNPPFWHKIPEARRVQCLLLVVVGLVFLPVLGASFLNYDDNVNVYKNIRITQFSLASLLAFWTSLQGNLYIPLTYTVWGGLATLSGLLPAADNAISLHPSLFHAANLLLHGASALTLFAILRRLVTRPWAAGAGALFFAIHPVQVEAVAWVTGLKDVLSGFFALLALERYLASVTDSSISTPWRVSHHGVNSPGNALPLNCKCLEGAPDARKRPVSYTPVCEQTADKADGVPCKHLPWRDRRYLLATLALVAALLAKPGAVTVPLLAALLAHCLRPRPLRQLALELGPWATLVLPVVLATKLAQPAANHSFLPALWQRFLVAGDAITFYLGQLLMPITLGPDYGRTPQYVLAKASVYASGALPYLLAFILFWRFRKAWPLTIAGLFLTPLLPVLGLIPFDFQEFSTVADRYLYLALLGPALGLAWLAGRFGENRFVQGAVIALILALAAKSAAQVRLWHEPFTFNTHMVAVNPQSAAGHANLGVNLKDAGRTEEAIAAFEKAISLAAPSSPHTFLAYLNLGQIAEQQGRPKESEAYYQKAMAVNQRYADVYAGFASNQGDVARADGDLERALQSYQMAVEAHPDSAADYANLGLTYKELDQPDKAIAAYRRAIELNPGFAEVYSNLALLLEDADRNEAIRLYQQALALQPGLGEAANNLGLLYLKLQRPAEALPLFQRAITAYPTNPLPHDNLGQAQAALGLLAEAESSFKQALRVDPTFAPAVNNLSKLELKRGNIQTALELADQAKSLGFEDPEHLKALQTYRK